MKGNRIAGWDADNGQDDAAERDSGEQDGAESCMPPDKLGTTAAIAIEPPTGQTQLAAACNQPQAARFLPADEFGWTDWSSSPKATVTL